MQEALGHVDIDLTDVVNNGRINHKYNLINSRNGVIHVDIRWKTIWEDHDSWWGEEAEKTLLNVLPRLNHTYMHVHQSTIPNIQNRSWEKWEEVLNLFYVGDKIEAGPKQWNRISLLLSLFPGKICCSLVRLNNLVYVQTSIYIHPLGNIMVDDGWGPERCMD